MTGPERIVSRTGVPGRPPDGRHAASLLTTPTLHVVLAFVCVCALLCAPRAAANEPAVADFDGDGVADHVAISRQDATIVQVWLSHTGTTAVIHSREPVLRIAVADLDGDHRAELVAAGRSALRVWMRTRGGFSAYRARHRSAARRLSRERRHAGNADPFCAELTASGYSLVAPSLHASGLSVALLYAEWIVAAHPVRGPTARPWRQPFTPRPPPVLTFT